MVYSWLKNNGTLGKLTEISRNVLGIKAPVSGLFRSSDTPIRLYILIRAVINTALAEINGHAKIVKVGAGARGI